MYVLITYTPLKFIIFYLPLFQDYNGLNLIHQDSFPENTITPIINTSTTMTDETTLNDIKLYEDKNSTVTDEECYGKYVTLRLRSIFDDSIKSEIKHEIDLLFNSLTTKHQEQISF